MPHETLPADIAYEIRRFAAVCTIVGQCGALEGPSEHGKAVREDIRIALEAAILRHLNGKAEEERALSVIVGGEA